DRQGNAEPGGGPADLRPDQDPALPRLLHRLRQTAAVRPPAGAHAEAAGADRLDGREGPGHTRQRVRPGRLLLPAGRRPRRGGRLALTGPIDTGRIERAVREILLAIGEDPDRDGLAETPARVARAYAEQFSGLSQRPEDVLATVFDADYDELILVRDIEVYSTCEHHLVPFFGFAHVGYIPNEKRQ